MMRVSLLVVAAAACGCLLAAPGTTQAQSEGGWWSGFDLWGLDGPVFALTHPEDHRYFGLIAGGSFSCAGRSNLAANLARWRGDWTDTPERSFWKPFNPGGPWNGPIYALESWADGTADHVVVGGAFTASTGQPYDYIAAYYENTGTHDSTWSAMQGPNGPVTAITRDQAGRIVAGGFFNTSVPSGLHYVARWDGSSWNNMDGGLPGPVLALCPLGTNDILAGGYFGATPSRPDRFNLAKFSSQTGHWTYLSSYLNGPVFDLMQDPSTGTMAYLGGAFTRIGLTPVDYIATTNGTTISLLVPAGTGPNGPVHDIAYFYGNDYADILVGGEFTAWGDSAAGGVAGRLGLPPKRNMQDTWGAFGSGVAGGPRLTCVYALTSYRYATPSASLVAGGEFTIAGGYPSLFVGLWDDHLPAGYVPPASGGDRALSLEPNVPNPFNPETTLRYTLPRATHVLFTVHDVEGRYVATLADGLQDEGEHEIPWEGRDGEGRPLPGGVYFTRLVTPERTVTGKVVIAR